MRLVETQCLALPKTGWYVSCGHGGEPVPLPREVEFFRACENAVREEAYFWHDLSLLGRAADACYTLDGGHNLTVDAPRALAEIIAQDMPAPGTPATTERCS